MLRSDETKTEDLIDLSDSDPMDIENISKFIFLFTLKFHLLLCYAGLVSDPFTIFGKDVPSTSARSGVDIFLEDSERDQKSEFDPVWFEVYIVITQPDTALNLTFRPQRAG